MATDVDTAFLDRDGVINRKAAEGEYVTTWREFEFLPGAIEAVRTLHAAGIRVMVVTNQRGIALGRVTADEVDALHDRMRATVDPGGDAIAGVFVCPHDLGACDCRKPGVGLFRQAVEAEPAIDLARSIVIGDSRADIEAGARLGCRTYLVGSAAQATELRAQGLAVTGAGESLLSVVLGLLATPNRAA